MVTCGATSGRQVQFDLRTLFGPNITVFGSRMGTREDLKEALGHLNAGRLKPVVDRVFAFDAIQEALQYMESGAHFWKVVVMSKGKGGAESLSATAYVLSQEEFVKELPAEEFTYAAFGTYQVTLERIERETGLDFGGLRKLDPLAGKESEGTNRIQGPDDLLL